MTTENANNSNNFEEATPLPENVTELQEMGDAIWAKFFEATVPNTKDEDKALKAEYKKVAAKANEVAGKQIMLPELKMPKKDNKKAIKTEMHISVEGPVATTKKAKPSKDDKQAALKSAEKPKMKKVVAETPKETIKGIAAAAKKAATKAAPAKKAAAKKAATKAAPKKAAAKGTIERRAALTEKEVAGVRKDLLAGKSYKEIKEKYGLKSFTPIAHIKKNKMVVPEDLK